ncbi:hypothetical protein EV715DRAFT_274542 [Schizophyllum commune]
MTSTINAVCPNLGTPHGISPFCTLSPALSFRPPGSLISATATISASLVQNSGTNFDTARRTARWCATASSRVRERRSRRAERGALLEAAPYALTTSFIVVSTDTRSSAFACHVPTNSAAHCISSRLPLMHSSSNAMRTTLLRASEASVSDSRASSSTTRRWR